MASARPVRLLIVEDNVADVLLMREALRELFHKPLEIVTVSDGVEALSMLDKQIKFDIVILDWFLPRVGGHAFLERCHSQHPPIVVFTSSWNPEDEKRALALGAQEFIRKPMSYEAYVNAVCGTVERWGKYRANKPNRKSAPKG